MDTERFVGSGRSVKTSIGTLEVNEPSLKELLKIVDDIPALLSIFSQNFSGDDEADNASLSGIAALTRALRDEKFQDPFFRIVAKFCGITPDEASKLKASDLVKLTAEFKESVDWEDLKDTFFTILPPTVREALSSAFQKVTEAVTEAVVS